MTLQTWHIQGSSFHFGRLGLGQEVSASTFPSDSLFGAFVAAHANLFGSAKTTTFLAPFKAGTPSFCVTSTFPYAGDVKFFPAPMRFGTSKTGATSSIALKALKKIEWLSADLFNAAIRGTSLVDLLADNTTLQNGKLLVSQTEVRKLPPAIQTGTPIYQMSRRPRVTVARTSAKSTLFHTGSVHYAADCGLWFGVQYADQTTATTALLDTLCLELSDAGLGGERNVGYGNCTFVRQAATLQLPTAQERPYWTNLSRFLPQQAELSSLKAAQASYRLETIDGWITSPQSMGQRKRRVNMIGTGAVLGSTASVFPGSMVDVAPHYANNRPISHPVYRMGHTVAIGLAGAQA